MPALPDVPNVIRLTFHQSASADKNVITRLFVHYTGTAPTTGTMSNWLNTMSASWASSISPLQTANVSLTQIAATDLTSSTGGQAVNNTAHVGTRVGQALPAGTSALINYLIGRRYRGGKPRSYLVAGSGADVNDGQAWTPTFTAAVNSAWGTFTGSFSTSPPSGTSITGLVSVSYYKGFTVVTGSTGRAHNVSTPRATPIVDNITGFTVDPNFGSQRRRDRL